MYDVPGLETNSVAPNTTSPSTMSQGSRQRRCPKHDDPGLKMTPLSHVRRPLAWHPRTQDNNVVSNTTALPQTQRAPLNHNAFVSRTTASSSRRHLCLEHDILTQERRLPLRDDGMGLKRTASSQPQRPRAQDNAVVPCTTSPGLRQTVLPQTRRPLARRPGAQDNGVVSNTTTLGSRRCRCPMNNGP
jgi:hypothetical protein